MMLLSNETELVSSNGRKIILTNQRVHMTDREWGNDYSITIFLEDISSIETRYSGNMLLFGISLVAAAFCFYFYVSGNNDAMAGIHTRSEEISSTAAIVFFLFYWLSRKRIVSITSHGGKALNFEVGSLPEIEIQKFITQVQEAKLQRVGELRS